MKALELPGCVLDGLDVHHSTSWRGQLIAMCHVARSFLKEESCFQGSRDSTVVTWLCPRWS